MAAQHHEPDPPEWLFSGGGSEGISDEAILTWAYVGRPQMYGVFMGMKNGPQPSMGHERTSVGTPWPALGGHSHCSDNTAGAPVKAGCGLPLALGGH